VVRIVDTVRYGSPIGRIRSERIHHSAKFDDPGVVLQSGQLHGPLDIRHHTPEVQKRIDKTDVEEEDQEIGAGLRHEEELGGSVAFQQEWRGSQELFELRRRVR